MGSTKDSNLAQATSFSQPLPGTNPLHSLYEPCFGTVKIKVYHSPLREKRMLAARIAMVKVKTE